MSPTLPEILGDTTFYQLSGLAGLTLFFALAAVREFRNGCLRGDLYLTIALFLALAHAVVLENALTCDPRPQILSHLDLWVWLVVLLGPALIALFFVRSLISFVLTNRHVALIKLFFGLTLFCYLYMLGTNWPVDVRGFLTIVWIVFLFKTETATAR